MRERHALKLDVSGDTLEDTLRGPGSPLTEPLPSTSSAFYSPLPSSINSERQSERLDAVSISPALRGENIGHDLGGSDSPLRVVIVGGDVGAFVMALALAKSERICVTLVNAVLGPLSILGVSSSSKASLLLAPILAHLDNLGKWEGCARSDVRSDSPTNLESVSGRWKGKGMMNEASIAERIREEGRSMKSIQLCRYSDGHCLGFQEYSVSTRENVSVVAINTETLIAILRDVCLLHPRIEIRPRGIVRAVLPGGADFASFSQYGPQDGGTSASPQARLSAPSERSRPLQNIENRRRARESFIHMDDDDQDDLLSSLSVDFSTIVPGKNTSLSEVLRNLPSPPLRPNPFLASDDDVAKDDLSSITASEDSHAVRNPSVVLTSGESLEGDVILGTEGPESKVLDSIRATVQDSYSGSGEPLREDGIFRTVVATSGLLEDPDLRSMDGKAFSWLGPGRILTVYPLNVRLLHISLTVEGGRSRLDFSEEAEEGTSIAWQMKREINGWCSMATKLVALADSASYEVLYDYNPLNHWLSSSGRVAVLGNAAHPLFPFSHQALSTTIYDALTLGAFFQKVFSHPTLSEDGMCSPLAVPRLLRAFVSLRRPHCLRKQIMLREGRDLLMLPDGEEQRHRDETLRQSGWFCDEEKHVEWFFDPFQEVERWWKMEFGSWTNEPRDR